MVRLRKISLAESRGSSKFFNNKVVSDFKFSHCLKKNYCVNMVHLRKISLAESRGSSRFFNNKVVSDFDFGHFLKKSI